MDSRVAVVLVALLCVRVFDREWSPILTRRFARLMQFSRGRTEMPTRQKCQIESTACDTQCNPLTDHSDTPLEERTKHVRSLQEEHHSRQLFHSLCRLANHHAVVATPCEQSRTIMSVVPHIHIIVRCSEDICPAISHPSSSSKSRTFELSLKKLDSN